MSAVASASSTSASSAELWKSYRKPFRLSAGKINCLFLKKILLFESLFFDSKFFYTLLFDCLLFDSLLLDCLLFDSLLLDCLLFDCLLFDCLLLFIISDVTVC